MEEHITSGVLEAVALEHAEFKGLWHYERASIFLHSGVSYRLLIPVYDHVQVQLLSQNQNHPEQFHTAHSNYALQFDTLMNYSELL